MSHDRRMDSATESGPDQHPGDPIAQHPGDPIAQTPGDLLVKYLGPGESLLAIDLPADWSSHPSLFSRSIERSKSLPAVGTWQGVLRQGSSLESLQDDDLRQGLEHHRDRLAPGGRLLVVLEGPSTPPARWLRLSSEIGFIVSHSGPFTVSGFAGSLLALQRDDHRIRSYRPGDESGILELFRRCFHKSRSLERWVWEYKENPWYQPTISLAEDPDGQLTTHYAGYGMPFWYRGRSFNALQIGDTMSDPAARNVGRGTRSLLARTVRHFFACHRGTGLGFHYGFNTGPIQRFCRWFIGGMEVEPVNYRWREAGSPEPIRGYKVSRIKRVTKSFDRFFDRVAPHYGYLVQRNAQYLHWRYLSCPDTDYRLFAVHRWGRLVGWGAFKRGDESMVWGDALFAPRHCQAAANLVAAAWSSFAETDPNGTEAWFPDRPQWWHEQLATLGFEQRESPSKLGFMILPDGEVEAPLEELYYSMGDGDLF